MMTSIRVFFLSILMITSNWNEVGKRNAAIKAATKSYEETDYEASITNHLRLVSEYNITTPNVTYDLALSQHYGGQLEQAGLTYQSLYQSPDKNVASFAYNQNGVILGGEKKYDEALEAFKMSLINNPTNESARYNYELLSRWLEKNPEQQEQQQDKQDKEDQEKQEEQDKQDQKSEEKKDGEGEEETKEDEASESQKKEDKEGEKSQEEKKSEEASDIESDLSDREKALEKVKEKLQEMNLSPEQAAQILEAMNAAELRYIQQNKKKPTKKPQRGLPEW
jgi:hypothetical protein